MCRLLLIFLLLAGQAWGADYYVAESGTETVKGNATSPSTPLSLAGFEGESFSGGDTVYFMGTFNLESAGEDIDLPSGGSAFGSATQITYASYASNPAILDGGGKDVQSDQLMATGGVDFVVVDGFTFQNIYTAGGSAGQALSVVGSDVVVQNCIFTGWATTSFTGDGAWIEVGGDGSDPDNSQTISGCSFGFTDGEHISSHTADDYDLTISGCQFDSSGAAGAGAGTNAAIVTTSTTVPDTLTIANTVFTEVGINIGNPDVLTSMTVNRSRFIDLDGNNVDERITERGVYNFCTFTGVKYPIFFRADGDTFNNCTFYYGGSVLSDARIFVVQDASNVVNFNNSVFYNYDEPFWATTTATYNLTDVVHYGRATDWIYNGTPTVNETRVTADTDPLFTDAAGGDLTLTVESTLIDAGADVCSAIGGDVYDLAGTQVCASGALAVDALDVGAYEYVSSGGSYINGLLLGIY